MKRHRKWASVVAAVLLAGLGGCALPPEPSADDGDLRWAPHRVRAEAVSSWRLEGKVGVRRNDTLWSAGMHWLHERHRDRLNLLGPGGRPLLRLQSRPGEAAARDSKGRVYRAETFEEIVVEALGFEMPVSSLRYWVRGLPDPDAALGELRVGRGGLVEELSQRGWRVRYLAYQPSEALPLRTLELPARLVLTNGDLKITIVAQRWKLLGFGGDAGGTI